MEDFNKVLRDEIDREIIEDIVELARENETFEQRWLREFRKIIKEENEQF